MKCLEKEPSRRYGSAEDLAEDLARYRSGRPIRARPVGRLERVWRWSLRNPALAAAWSLGATAAAAVVVLSVVYGVQRSYAAERLRDEQVATEHRRLEAVAARQVAADRYALALKAFQSLIVEVGPRLRGSPELRDVQRKLLTTAASGLEELTRGAPDRSIVRAYLQWGDIERTLGRTTAARARFEDARRVAQALLDAEPNNPEAVRDLAASRQKLGDIAILTGPTEDARDEFLECLRLCRKAVEMARDDIPSRLALASALDRVGDAAFQLSKTDEAGIYYREALRIREALDNAGQGGPEAKVGLTVSHTKIGDQALQRNALDEADAAYKAGTEAAARLVEQEPDNPGYLRRLTVLYIKRGDIATRVNDLATAESWFRKSLKTDEARAELDPTNDEVRRDLAISYNRVGQAELDLKKYAAARASFLKGLAPTKKRVEADPRNRQAQRDLTVSYNKIGDASFELGSIAEARDNYTAALTILERLAETDRADADVRLGLAIAYERVGDVNLKLGHLGKASRAYRSSLALGEEIAKADPANVDAQAGLIVAYSKVAEAAYRSADPAPAVEGLDRALATLAGLRAKGLLKGQPIFDRWQEELEQAAVLARSMVAVIQSGTGALKPSDNPKARAEILHARVVALANRRRLDEAAATAETLRAQAEPMRDPEVLLYAARGFATLAGADGEPARSRHAAQAIALLGQLQAAGAFRSDAGRAAWMAEAEDLDPLRGRTDFQAILAGLKTSPAALP